MRLLLLQLELVIMVTTCNKHTRSKKYHFFQEMVSYKEISIIIVTTCIVYIRYRKCHLLRQLLLLLSKDLPRRRSLPKIAARWRYRLPINNLTAHCISQYANIFTTIKSLKMETEQNSLDYGKSVRVSLFCLLRA